MLIFYPFFLCLFAVRGGIAFLPDWNPWAKNSLSHSDITRRALKQAAIKFFNDQSERPPGSQRIPLDNPDLEDHKIFSYFYGTSYISARQFSEARKKIASSSAQVDKQESTRNAFQYHFHDEGLEATNSNIQYIYKLVVAAVFTSNFETAWTNLGYALHVLQDFYSHSNYVELGNTLIFPDIGNPNVHAFEQSSIASIDDSTCSDCDSFFGFACIKNILPNIISDKILTSGYFSNILDDPSGDKPGGKCSHGGPMDSTRNVYPRGGITKDTSSPQDSPHSFFHQNAATLAEHASIQYLEALRQNIGNEYFGNLMGLYIGKSLAIVMDTTHSTNESLNAVKERVREIVKQNQEKNTNPINKYILVPFNASTVGPVVLTTAANEFIDAIDQLKMAQSPDGCLGLSISSILKAADLSDFGSPIFVFTQIDAKDVQLEGAVEAVAKDKQLQTTFFGYHGTCMKTNPINNVTPQLNPAPRLTSNVYYQLASATGGLVFTAGNDSIFSTTAFMEEALEDLVVNILRLSGSKANLSESFFVDNTVTKLTVSIVSPQGYLPDFWLIPPSYSVTECQVVTNVTTVLICQYSEPAVGIWQLNIHQADDISWTSLITANSPLVADFDLYKLPSDSREPFLYREDGNPLAGSTVFVQYSVSDKLAVLSTMLVFNASDGQIFRSIPLEYQGEMSNIYVANFTVPSEPFYLGVMGLDTIGNLFQRVNPTTISPTFMSIKFSANDLLTICNGEPLDINLNATNFGPSAMFNFLVFDSLGFIQRYLYSLNIREGESGTLSVTVRAPNSATVGMSTRVSITAMVAGDNSITNFLQLWVTVASRDSNRPKCQIIQKETECPAISNYEGFCSQYHWSVKFGVVDEDSGLGNLITSNISGLAEWHLPTDYKGKPGQNFIVNVTCNCCVESVTLTVLDMAGYSDECRVLTPHLESSTRTTSISHTTSNTRTTKSTTIITMPHSYIHSSTTAYTTKTNTKSTTEKASGGLRLKMNVWLSVINIYLLAYYFS